MKLNHLLWLAVPLSLCMACKNKSSVNETKRTIFLDKANMDVVLDNLQDFYVFKTMSIYLNILNVKVIFKKDYPTVYFERVLSLITKEYCYNKPEIGIYYNLIKMNLETKDVPFYRDAVKILKANKS